MQLINAKKDRVEAIANIMAEKAIKQPIFMYYCPDVNKRADYIKTYFRYYVYEWSEYDTLLCDEENNALITLINPRSFEYRFKGKGAFAMKRHKDAAERIFRHRKVVRGIVHIIAPGSVSPRVMTIYGNADTDMPAVEKLIDEAIELADKENNTLVYETFSKKYVEAFEKRGFAVAYRKMYGSTRFIQTIMVKYPNRRAAKQEDYE